MPCGGPIMPVMSTTRLAILSAAALAAVIVSPVAGVAQRPAVADIQVQPGDAQVQVRRTTQFFAQAYDRGNNPLLTVTTFTWRSSNLQVATVDENGVATGVGPGVAQITARYGSGRSLKVSQPATLEVLGEAGAPQPQAQPSGAAGGAAQPAGARAAMRPGPGCAALARQQAGTGAAEGLLVSPQRLVLIKGESFQLQFRTVRGAMGEPAEAACVVFTVDASRVALVDTLGLVTSMGDTGRAMVTATVPGARFVPRQVAVEVRGDPVQFDTRSRTIAVGTVDTLELVVPAQEGRRLEPASTSFQFVSSDPAKVAVSPVAPIITALAPGTARITATSPTYPDITTTVTVHKPIHRLIGSPIDTLVTLAIQATATLGVRLFAADSTVVENVPLHWTRPDTTLVQFDTATMTLHGLKAGDTRMTVWAAANRTDSIFRHWHVRVVAGGLTVARPRFALPLGEQVPLAITLLDDRRRPLGPAPGLAFGSSDDAVARVASDGRVSGVGLGHAQVVAKAPWDSTVRADAFVVGDLVVPAERSGRWDLLMVQRGDPPRLRPLTQDSALERDVAWSPDRTRIAYVAAPPRSEQFDLYVASVDGSEVQRLTRDSVSARSPVFVGPSGDQIVFESGRTGRTQLFVINRDGTGRRQLTSGDSPATQPDVSPDGSRVLYVSLREKSYSIYQRSLDGTGAELRLTNGRLDTEPLYASDGRSFYFLRAENGKPPTKRVFNQDLSLAVAPPPAAPAAPGAAATAPGATAATAISPAGVFVQSYGVTADGRTLALTVELTEPRGTLQVQMFDRVTGAVTPFTLPGATRLGVPAFRPNAPEAGR